MQQLKEGMLLYHGSYMTVDKPSLDKCAKFKDFGQGFYLTTSRAQARSFAKLSLGRARTDRLVNVTERTAWVSVFRVGNITGLKTIVFQDANQDWLHCIVAHRRSEPFEEMRRAMKDYDVIGGKVANDDTNSTINIYITNGFGLMGSTRADNFCIGLLIPERLKDQFCFRSKRAIACLKYIKSESIECEGQMNKEKTLMAMNLVTILLVEDFSKESGQPAEDVLLDFMQSRTAVNLYNDSLKLWWDGPSVVGERYKKELATKHDSEAK